MDTGPSWFDLKHYPPLTSSGEWANAIIHRLLILECCQRFLDSQLNRDDIVSFFETNLFLTNLVPMPSITSSVDAVALESILDKFSYRAEDTSLFQDLFESKDKLDAKTDLRAFAQELAHFIYSRLEFQSHLIGLVEPSTSTAFLIVDLDHDEETLIEDFKKTLSKVRPNNEKITDRKPYTSIHFERWHTRRVLPLFDLQLWSAITSSNLTWPQLGELLWPNSDVDVSQRVRKESQPLMKEVVTIETFKRLARNSKASSEN